jgi:isopentenyldiphosphate isomerase
MALFPLCRTIYYRIRYAHDEWFEIFNEHGEKLGMAPRSICHSGTFLIHKVVHILIFDRTGSLLLQRRAVNKDIQPDKWDTSVGGHMSPGETAVSAVRRECLEELGFDSGITADDELYQYIMISDIEKEWVTTFRIQTELSEFCFDRKEISEVRFWTREEIEKNIGKGLFTPNFEDEYRRYMTTMGATAGRPYTH